ncbi:hypothetical protein ACQKWADRAFT_281410 [Trichoderma austrokoningii]
MAHPNRPSLMSRLFPQDRPARLSTLEDSSSATLFSVEKAPFRSSSSTSLQESIRRNDLYQACFASFNAAPAEDRVHQEKSVEGDILEPLKKAFAEEAVELHNSTRNKLLEAQKDMNARVSNLNDLTSAITSAIDDIYANLSYPPSATVCSAADFPSATIDAHLASTKDQLEEAKKQLRDLQREWEDAVRLGYELHKELASMDKTSGQSGAASPGMISLKEQVEQLVLDNTQALDEIEDTYKEDVQAETMKMMQAMMD